METLPHLQGVLNLVAGLSTFLLSFTIPTTIFYPMWASWRFTRTVAVAFRHCWCSNHQARLSFATVYWLNMLYIKWRSFWKRNQDFLCQGCYLTLWVSLSPGSPEMTISSPSHKRGRVVDLTSCVSHGRLPTALLFQHKWKHWPHLTFHCLYFFSKCPKVKCQMQKVSVRRKCFFLVPHFSGKPEFVVLLHLCSLSDGWKDWVFL